MKATAAVLIATLMVLLGACQKAPALKSVQATETRVEYTISTTTAGTVEARQQAVLAFGTLGRVDRILVQAGAIVKKDELLATEENRDVQSVFENCEKELKRTTRLFKEKLVSQANLDDARRTCDVARANLDKTEIRAPFDGVITEVNLQAGETAQPQTPVDKPPLRIVDREKRIIKGSIDEVDLSKVRVGAPARIKVLAVRPKPFEARVDRIVPYVSTTKEQERTAKVELSLTGAAKDETIPVGSSAEIEIIVDSRDKALAVPSRSVLGTGSQKYVYRIKDERLNKVSITTGVGNYDRTEVLSGLSAGDLIAIPGDQELQDGMKVSPERTPWP